MINGRKGTGAKYIIKSLCRHARDAPFKTIIDGNPHSLLYSDIIPSQNIQYEFSEKYLSDAINEQQIIHQQRVVQIKDKGYSDIDSRHLIILDDCFCNSAWPNIIQELFRNIQKMNIILIISSQYPLELPPEMCDSMDYSIITRQPSMQNRVILYKYYAFMFPTFESFCMALDGATKNFSCLIIDNTSCSNTLTNKIYWYKASRDIVLFPSGNKVKI